MSTQKEKEIWGRWYQKNKEKKKAYMKQYRNRKEVKKKMKIYNKKYHQERKDYFKKKHREYPKEYFKQYREKNKEKIRIRGKKYYLKNKIRIKKYMKKYYLIPKNIEKKRVQQKKYFKNVVIKRCIENLKSWEGYIPKKTKCQICKKIIYFNDKKHSSVINFDHKKLHNIINRVSPTEWLKFNKRTPESQKIWEKANFGKLCLQCNGGVPTKNRKQFVRNLIKYVFGNNAKITDERRLPKL